jgi:hypothetical protein
MENSKRSTRDLGIPGLGTGDRDDCYMNLDARLRVEQVLIGQHFYGRLLFLHTLLRYETRSYHVNKQLHLDRRWLNRHRMKNDTPFTRADISTLHRDVANTTSDVVKID